MQAAPYGMMVSAGKTWHLVYRHEGTGRIERVTVDVTTEGAAGFSGHKQPVYGDLVHYQRSGVRWAEEAKPSSLSAEEERAGRAAKAIAAALATIRSVATTANGMDMADCARLIDAMDDLRGAQWYLTSHSSPRIDITQEAAD